MSRQRRFYAGWADNVGGVEFRCVQGKKHPDDLKLEWLWGDEWVPLTLDVVFLAVDMICENEDVLYPYPAKGGQYTLDAVKAARIRGWHYAVELLHRQRGEKQRRLDEGDAA